MKTQSIKNSQFSKYTVTYTFKHSSMGFQNQITVEALDETSAIDLAKIAVSECYGSKMLPRFTFE